MVPPQHGPTLDPAIVQQVLLNGDLSKLTSEQRISYYNRVCESVGLNPLTQPFAYLKLNGKEVLYALKAATEQLRFIHSISIDPKGFTREVIEGVYVVTAPASMPNGRTDVSTGAVPIDGLKGESRANAMMKAETKAKRRVTLSICGLGMLDETEIESIPIDKRQSLPELAVVAPEGFENWLTDLETVAENGTDALAQAWSQSPLAMRRHLLETNRAAWDGAEGLKEKAKKAKPVEAVSQ